MFDPRLYRNACSELRPSEEKIEEMIAMTANHGCKKKIRHPLRMGAVIAATMALLTIGASAAANPEMVESFTMQIASVFQVGELRQDLPTPARPSPPWRSPRLGWRTGTAGPSWR